MPPHSRSRSVVLGLLLAGLSFAPAPAPEPEPAQPAPLAEARYQAALKQFDLVWSYYQQARIDSYQVYVWSRLILDSRRAMTARPADRIAALEEHLDRMKRLEGLIRKVRRLGFGLSYDVGATEYYHLEAEAWLAEARESH
jgi:hypothetical protein